MVFIHLTTENSGMWSMNEQKPHDHTSLLLVWNVQNAAQEGIGQIELSDKREINSERPMSLKGGGFQKSYRN